MARRRRRRRPGNRRGMFCVSVVMVLLLSVLLFKSSQLKTKNEVYKEKEEALSGQLSDEQKRTDEIEDLSKYMETKQYIEEVAKDKLGLVYPDEIIFKEKDE